MARLAFIGGGGFAKEVLEIAALRGHDVVGYSGSSEGILDRPYWGPREELLDRREAFDGIVIAFGAVDRKSIGRRREMIEWLRTNALPIGPALVSPHAVIASGATVGAGSVIGHGVIVSVDARIGEAVILNIGAIIGHDAVIGDNVTVAPAAFVGGQIRMGANGLIGPRASLLQGLQVGEDVIVGVGASVVRNLGSGATVMPLRSKILA